MGPLTIMLWLGALGAAVGGLVTGEAGLLALAGAAFVIGAVLHVLGQLVWRLLDDGPDEPIP